MKCSVYDFGSLSSYVFVVILARYQEKWVFCRQKKRQTWEAPGGHIEVGETPEMAARRELYEETGATDFTLQPAFDYWASDEPHEKTHVTNSSGQVFLAHIRAFGPLPEMEMAEIGFFDGMPGNPTYPDILRTIFPRAMDLIGQTAGRSLRRLPGLFSICQIASPDGVDMLHPFTFLSRTDEELSLVCPTETAPQDALAMTHGFCGFKIEGVLDFGLIGILSEIAGILARGGISLFAISTYNTDYLWVREEALTQAAALLTGQGYRVR